MNRLFKNKNGDLHWGWKTAILLLGTIVFGVALNIILMTILTFVHISQGLMQDQAMQKATEIMGGFIPQVILSVFQLGFMFWLVRWIIVKIEKQTFDWSHLGLGTNNRIRNISFGILLALTLTVLTFGIGFLIGTLSYVGNGFNLFSTSKVIVTLLLGMILAFASGFGEEIAFRGYLQTRISQRYNQTVAVVIVAVLFALMHPLSTAIHPLMYLATAILVGILFGTLYVRTRSLWAGIALHTLWNYLQIAVFAASNATDGRFFGAPLFVFDNLSATPHALLEFGVILLGLIGVLYSTRLPHAGQKAIWNA
jgi:membrane protease YdiL (CAAX protease family)